MAANVSRRELLSRSALLGSFLIAGQWVTTTPAEARQRGFTPSALSNGELDALETLGESLVPGAQAAGLGAYLDSQLAAGQHSKLMGKYVGVSTDSQPDFYRALAANIRSALQQDLQPVDLPDLMLANRVPEWSGPPASYALFVLRADALDVVWGTQAGYGALGIPYRAHIDPETPW